MKLFRLLKKVDKAIAYVVAIVLSLVVPAIILNGYLKTPKYLINVKDRLSQDKEVADVIGEYRGYDINYSNHALGENDTSKFEVKIIGSCDSAYVKLFGYYYMHKDSLIFTATDSLMQNKCM